MIPRYAHPEVTELWSDEWTYGTWLEIERSVLQVQLECGQVDDPGGRELLTWLHKVHINDEAAGQIRAIERTSTKHDVGAFLEWLRLRAPRGQYIHFGLTSSDLVDTTQAMRFRELYNEFASAMGDLVGEVNRHATDRTPLVGRTHGQPGEPTSMGVRASHWLATVEPALLSVLHHTRGMQIAKLSGPMGTFAHNPPEVEAGVAALLGLEPMSWGASQVVPRSTLALWSSACSSVAAACAKIATDLRLMNLLNQVSWPKADGQIGSSAMAHKNNPIVAEQICGLARVAQGYASMLQPVDLWLERDISHSSVERIAVPDLWHVTFRVVGQTIEMLRTLELHGAVLGVDLADHANELWVHRVTLDGVLDGDSLTDARQFAMEFDNESYDIVGDAAWFTRNYPFGGSA